MVQLKALLTSMRHVITIGYSIFCVGYGIYKYKGALTQLSPVVLTGRFHIMTYTHCVAFCCISFLNPSLFSHGCVHMRKIDIISNSFV